MSRSSCLRGTQSRTGVPAGRRPCARAVSVSGMRRRPVRPLRRRAGSGGCAAGARGRSGGRTPWRASATGADLQRVLELALADTLELENTVPRTRALTQLVAVAARVKETTELEARLRALEDGVWRETPDAGS